ncbi:MAG: glycosyltransferase family 4 protein, partial [Candidatus Eisenbacteria sp.]|nr:glycosyltransferase family 4 protein [Candidatus Eisenbacteria bacterium]
AMLLRRRADVVILTRVRDYWLGGLAARCAGVPALLRLGVVRRPRPNYVMDRLRYGALPSALLVNAEAIRRTLMETPWMASRKIHVVYNGVDAPGRLTSHDKVETRKRIGVSPEEMLIVGAGRLAVEKRWNWFVDAVADLVRSNYPVAARLLGQGGERDAILARIHDKQLGDHFLLTGSRRDAQLWIASADIVVLPSSNEGISNVMLEAMGREVPVVATCSGGAGELFSDGRDVLMAATNDFGEFARRLERAVKDEGLRRSIGRGGYDIVRERLTWEAMTTSLERLLDSMAWSTP